MLQSLLEGLSAKPLDVQIWDCVPLVVTRDHAVIYAGETKLEFTPFESTVTIIGHAIALTPNKEGVQPEISIEIRQYIDSQRELGKRQGIILTGVDQFGSEAAWYINGAADQYLISPDSEQLEYDEETARLLEAELSQSDPKQLNINSFM